MFRFVCCLFVSLNGLHSLHRKWPAVYYNYFERRPDGPLKTRITRKGKPRMKSSPSGADGTRTWAGEDARPALFAAKEHSAAEPQPKERGSATRCNMAGVKPLETTNASFTVTMLRLTEPRSVRIFAGRNDSDGVQCRERRENQLSE
jgi:hypothetical protein